MTPRLTREGRIADAQYAKKSRAYGVRFGSSRPSPAERLRQRRKARAAVKGYAKKVDAARWKLFIRQPWTNPDLPQSRGTTTSQLVAMHLEAEENHAPVVGRTEPEQDHV